MNGAASLLTITPPKVPFILVIVVEKISITDDEIVLFINFLRLLSEYDFEGYMPLIMNMK